MFQEIGPYHRAGICDQGEVVVEMLEFASTINGANEKGWLKERPMEQESLLSASNKFASQLSSVFDALPESGWKVVVEPQLRSSVKGMQDNLRLAEGRSLSIRRRHVSLAKELAQESVFWLKLLVTVYPGNSAVARLCADCREIKKCLESHRVRKTS